MNDEIRDHLQSQKSMSEHQLIFVFVASSGAARGGGAHHHVHHWLPRAGDAGDLRPQVQGATGTHQRQERTQVSRVQVLCITK